MGSFIAGFVTATVVFAVVGAATEFIDTFDDVIAPVITRDETPGR